MKTSHDENDSGLKPSSKEVEVALAWLSDDARVEYSMCRKVAALLERLQAELFRRGGLMADAADKIDRLQARADGVERDAARYRWLRGHAAMLRSEWDGNDQSINATAFRAGQALDAAIDAAMSAETKEPT